MLFVLRPYRRVPAPCPVTDNAGPFQGQGTVLARERMSSTRTSSPIGIPETWIPLCVPPFCIVDAIREKAPTEREI
jgi:hypothetical protein